VARRCYFCPGFPTRVCGFGRLFGQIHVIDLSMKRAPANTPAILRLDPTWNPLRADPAFQKNSARKNSCLFAAGTAASTGPRR